MQIGRFGTLVAFAFSTGASGVGALMADQRLLGYSLMAVAGATGIVALGRYVIANSPLLRSWIRRVEPIHVIILGLLIQAIGVAWMFLREPTQSASPPIVMQVVTPAPGAPPKPTALEAAALPPVPAEVGARASRFVQLKTLVAEAAHARMVASSGGARIREIMKPKPPPSGALPSFNRLQHMANADAQTSWHRGLTELKRINAAAYKNRSLDLETIPELANPLLEAPDEQLFRNDAESRFNYRRFHFLVINVDKQAEALIKDMGRELSVVQASIKSTDGPEWLAKLEGDKKP